MRNGLIKALEEEGAKNKNLWLVVGDLGFSVIEKFEKSYPDQFLNTGPAEQNMTGIAAGLAATGKTVFTYSIANFPIMRCLEQIRNDVCYHNLDVKIVAVGAGFQYGALASSHHGTEDIGVLRTMPNMTIVAPGDRIESELATRALIYRPGPAYLRISTEEAPIHKKIPKFEIGKAITIRLGKDITLISTGSMLKTAVDVAELLKAKKIDAGVISMHTVKPLDEKAILAAAKNTSAIATLEEHQIYGGLGSAVSEVLAEQAPKKVPYFRFGITDSFAKKIGSRDFLRKEFGLDAHSIAARLSSALRRRA
jgi:transketolase